jgi:hypothetical protein
LVIPPQAARNRPMPLIFGPQLSACVPREASFCSPPWSSVALRVLCGKILLARLALSQTVAHVGEPTITART